MSMLIVANWKMHPQKLAEAKKLQLSIKQAAAGTKGVEIVIAPPSVFLRDLAKGERSRVRYAAQNVHWDPEGAHTGDISVPQIIDAGAQYVLVGHAERRAQGETDEQVRKKVVAVLNAGLKPILCVGEKERDPDGRYLSAFANQVTTALFDVDRNKLKNLVIAYEPVWAIGAETAMSSTDMHEVSVFIRRLLFEQFGKSGTTVPVLYGGSIDELNAAEMVREGEVQGLLVGRVSTEPLRFAALVKNVSAHTG